MDRRTFAILCHLLRNVGLSSTKSVNVEEMVAMLLHVLVYDVKNHNFLEALDGTYIKVNVLVADRPTFRKRKGKIVTNVLGVCDTKGDFVYVLVGWKGSTADSQILRDALAQQNELHVSKGIYYFSSNNVGQRYHLQEWRGTGNVPTNVNEYFNMKHYSARNVIERTFDVLYGRWQHFVGSSTIPCKSSVAPSEHYDNLVACPEACMAKEEGTLVECLVEFLSMEGCKFDNGTFRPS
ncbi:retrotransposon protein [Cucumis melo var. makuwa]|uniref:Retrotransposon protein n=1 Tax=Cucumis melo var. makuwa TaxID=1194695 RepID=A0A5A7VD12_CUCMM|nr:retrotransposon protein [Cucumis melo var. makuwa]TYJ99824.1 retrotransposon protein [Cucumis melo var. makuwa]